MGTQGGRWWKKAAAALVGCTTVAAYAGDDRGREWTLILHRLMAVIEAPDLAHPAELAWADLNGDGRYTPEDVDWLLRGLIGDPCLQAGDGTIICGGPEGGGPGPGGIIPPGPGSGGDGGGRPPGNGGAPPGGGPDGSQPLVRTLDLRIVRTAEDGGHLEEAEGQTPVGYLLINDDDDNANHVPDMDEPGPTARENDLVSIWISAYQTNAANPPQDLRGYIHFPPALRVYRSADRTDEVLPASLISMAQPQTLYVEAREFGLHSIHVGGNQLGVWDFGFLTATHIVGPVFVPDLSTHSYAIGWPGQQAAGQWTWETEGDDHQVLAANGDDATVLWGAGPDYGRLWVSPTPDFRLPFDVRVIDVAVGAPDDGPAFSVMGNFEGLSDIVAMNHVNNQDFLAIRYQTPHFFWRAKATLTGPDDDPAFGCNQIVVGFVQNVLVNEHNAFYADGPTTAAHNMQSIRFLDCSENIPPWYDNGPGEWGWPLPHERTITVQSSDAPLNHFPKYADLGVAFVAGQTDVIDSCHSVRQYDLWVAAAPRSNNNGSDTVQRIMSRQAMATRIVSASDAETLNGQWDVVPAGGAFVSVPDTWRPISQADLKFAWMLSPPSANTFGANSGGWSTNQ